MWGVSFVFYFRWWGVTLRVPGLAVWAAAYTGLYAGTALLGLGREWLGTLRQVGQPVITWVGIVVMAVIIQAALPQVNIAGRPVQTAAFVNVIEFVLPCWIVVRAMLLVWPGLAARLAILTIGPVAVGGVLFAYMIPMPGSSFTGTIPPLTAAEQEASDRLRGHVDALASGTRERSNGCVRLPTT